MRSALVPILLADPMPWAFKAPYAWDFLKDRARFAGGYKGALANTPGWTATPATHSAGGVLYASTASGALQSFASGELRRTDKGVLIEGAGTNLFLNSTAPVTQDINFASTGNRTLSVWGSGSVAVAQNSATITGAGTATQGSPITFNVTATGTCTFTVTGSPTIVQVETGAFATSPIVTAGASATRAADSLTVTGVSDLGSALSGYHRIRRSADKSAVENYFQIDDGTDDNRIRIAVDASDRAELLVVAGGVTQAQIAVTGAMAVETAYNIAWRVTEDSAQICRSGTLGTEDTSVTVPTGLTTIRFGAGVSGANPCVGYTERDAIFTRSLADAELQSIAP